MANRNEDQNQGQRTPENRTGAQNQESAQAANQSKRPGGEATERTEAEGGMQSGGTRKPDRTNEGEREENSNEQRKGDESENQNRGSQGNERGGQGNSGNNR